MHPISEKRNKKHYFWQPSGNLKEDFFAAPFGGVELTDGKTAHTC
jgi:hypothetical protein